MARILALISVCCKHQVHVREQAWQLREAHEGTSNFDRRHVRNNHELDEAMHGGVHEHGRCSWKTYSLAFTRLQACSS